MATDIHNKDFALRLVLKERLGGTRNWTIAPCKRDYLALGASYR